MASPFITYSPTSKKFEVNPDAARTLSKLTGPVAVLAVCGRARQGKSWLLNQILAKLTTGKGGGFQVASSHRPCTKGLWIWGQAIPRTLPSGQKYHLVLVDCEGIDAFDQTLDYSTQVFSLGVLLSSMLIYNQMGSIDESSVDKLSCVCEFAKRIKSKAGAVDEQELRALSPSFLWLLRDTYLTLDPGMATPKDYMEEVLRAGGDRSKDQTRASIKDVFPARDCFALIRPLTDEGQLAAMDRTPLASLRPEFQQGMERLINNILSNATPKQFRGNYITGSALASFAQAFVKVINEGGVPSLSSTWQAVIEAENRQAMDAGLEAYNTHIAPATTPAASKAPGSVEALEAAHHAALEAGLLAYRQLAMGVSPHQAMESEAKLRASMVARFQPLMVARIAEADMCARDMLNVRAVRLAELLGKDRLDADALHVQLGEMLVDYNKKASGPNKFKLAVEFMVNDVARPVANAAARAAKNAQAATMRADAAAMELSEANAKLTGLQRQMGSSQQDVAQAKQQLAASQAECARAKEAANQVQVTLARVEAAKEFAAREAAEMRARVDRLQEQLSAARAEAASKAAEVAQKTHQLDLAMRSETEARAAAEAAQMSGQGREQGLHEDVRRMGADLYSAQAQLMAKAQEVVQLNHQVAEAARTAHETKTALRSLQEERGFLQKQILSLQQELQQQTHSVPPAPEPEMFETGPSTDADNEDEPQRKKLKATHTPLQAAVGAEAGPSSGGPKSGGKHTPFSHEKEVHMAYRPTATASKRKLDEDAPAAPAQRGSLQLPDGATSIDKMTVQQIKDWLVTEAKAEKEVFELDMKKGKKPEWVKLAKQKLEEAL